MAKFRFARKSEVDLQIIDEMLELFNHDPNVEISWVSVSREMRRWGFHSRWGIFTRVDETSKWEEEGQLYVCSECGEIFPVLPGNVCDSDHCVGCGAELDWVN